MSGSDKWFRVSFNLFIFLMCAQLGLLITLKSIYLKAERNAKANEAQVDFKCGDFDKEENFWDLPKSQFGLLPNCLDEDCPESLWVAEKEQEIDLHVLSVKKARPSLWKEDSVEYGHFIDVKIQQNKKPLKLVLISQSLMQWNFKFDQSVSTIKGELEDYTNPDNLTLAKISAVVSQENWNISYPRKIDEVIIVGPELIWLDGLDANTKVTYFNKDQLCAYPTAWEEIANKNNEFRRLNMALKAYTQSDVTSFQGKTVGREFRVPFRSILALERSKKLSQQKGMRELASKDELGLQWKRNGQTLEAENFVYRQAGQKQTAAVPKNTRHAFYESGKNELYIINNHQFGRWDVKDSKFHPLHLPLNMPAMYWPTALAFNPYTSELFIYNEDRGGEIFAFNVVTSKWRKFAEKVGYSLMALQFDRDSETLFGVQHQANKLVSMVQFNKKGGLLKKSKLENPIDFSKNRWRANITLNPGRAWIKVSHPNHPGGDLQPVTFVSLPRGASKSPSMDSSVKKVE